MRSTTVSCGLALLLLTGCNPAGPDNPRTTNSADSSMNTGDSKNPINPSAPKTRGDFSTPKAAVETFIAAAKSRDADLLSQCFDNDSPGEFRKLREKTAGQKELDSLAEFVQGAEVVGVKEKGDGALVSVTFKERSEEITVKRSTGGWKILDF